MTVASEERFDVIIDQSMRWIGICERALDLMCRRAVTRESALGKPLATRQVIQHWIAESRAEINAARLLVLDTAEKMERHQLLCRPQLAAG